MRGLLVVVVLVGAGLAGCIGADPSGSAGTEDPVETTGEGSAMPDPVSLSSCREQFGLFPLPAEQAQSLPPGFEPVPYPGDPAGATVQLATIAYTCERSGPEGQETVSEMLTTLVVEPPEDLRNESIGLYYVLIDGVTTSEAMNETYDAWGLPRIDQGPVSLDLPVETPAAERGQAETELNGSRLRVTTTVPGPAGSGDPGKARLFGVDGRKVTGAVDHDWNATEAMGPGQARVSLDLIQDAGMGYHFWGFDTVLAGVEDLPDLSGGDATLLPADSEEVTAETVHTGFQGGEPTIGVLPSGTVFVQSWNETLRSTDGGETWEKVYDFTDPNPASPDGSLDPMLWADRTTERIYWDHVSDEATCTTLGWSEDEGATWTRNDHTCVMPVIDFQKLGGGPPGPDPNPLAGDDHPTVLYLCYRKPLGTNPVRGASQYHGGHCAASYDGGETWPVEARVTGCARDSVTGLGLAVGDCISPTARPAVAGDGTVYVPMASRIGISTDSGLTWRTIGGPDGMGIGDVEVTSNGTLYAKGFVDGTTHVARSSDGGSTWDGPWEVSPPDVETAMYTAFAASDDGRLGVAVVGTNRSIDDPSDAPNDTHWHLHLTVSEDADTDEPTFTSLRATDDPVQVGSICTRGGSCGHEGARNHLDFIDATVAPDGTFYVSYTDGCTGECATVDDPKPEDSRDSATSVAWFDGWSLLEGGGS